MKNHPRRKLNRCRQEKKKAHGHQEQENTFKTTKPTSGLSSQEVYSLSNLAP